MKVFLTKNPLSDAPTPGRWVYVDGKLVAVQERTASKPLAPYVIKDIEPYRAWSSDGRLIGSRSEHREYLRANGLVEMGNERPENNPRCNENFKGAIREARDKVAAGQAYQPGTFDMEETRIWR